MIRRGGNPLLGARKCGWRRVFPNRGEPVADGTKVIPQKIEASMAIRVKARSGESTEQMLRRFKKLCEKEGLTKDIKRKEFFEKPSERRRRAARKSVNRRLKDDGFFEKPAFKDKDTTK